MEPIISACGDICSECPRYMATQSSDNNKLEEIAQLWHRLGLRDHVVGIEEIKCTGCNKKPNCGYGITTCEHLSGKENCGECELFPCPKFDEIFRNSDKYDEICRQFCNPTEYSQLRKAFFQKKEVLSNIHQSKFSK